jgi:hypothetical protein
VVGHNHQVRLLKLQIRSLARPRVKGWRIAVEISNKLHVVAEVLEHLLQLGSACDLNLPAIVSMQLYYADHLVDIGANEGCHGHCGSGKKYKKCCRSKMRFPSAKRLTGVRSGKRHTGSRCVSMQVDIRIASARFGDQW